VAAAPPVDRPAPPEPDALTPTQIRSVFLGLMTALLRGLSHMRRSRAMAASSASRSSCRATADMDARYSGCTVHAMRAGTAAIGMRGRLPWLTIQRG